MTNRLRVVIVGNGKMPCDIMRQLADHGDVKVVAAIGDPLTEATQSRLATCCSTLNVPYLSSSNVNDPKIVDAVRQLRPTYLISANNFHIFKTQAIQIAERGIINFHNGPLPRYGGLNSCSWAIVNGESQHGVTWHLVDAGIDSGPILSQRIFPIHHNETAISLIARCIREGVDLFAELLPRLLTDTLGEWPQSGEDRLYYGAKARPFEGRLPWWGDSTQLDRLARALSFHPLPNLFYRPVINVEGYPPVHIGDFRIEVHSDLTMPPGRIGFRSGQLTVKAQGCAILIESLFDGDGVEQSADEAARRFGILDGAFLSPTFG